MQARDALRELVDGKTVRLETDITIRDQYRRLLAYVYVGGILVNLEMIRQGQAVLHTVPPNAVHVEEYRKAQSEARQAGRGVWGQQNPLGMSPPTPDIAIRGQGRPLPGLPTRLRVPAATVPPVIFVCPVCSPLTTIA